MTIAVKCLLCNQSTAPEDPSLCKTHSRIYRHASQKMKLRMSSEMAEEKTLRGPSSHERGPAALMALLNLKGS
jgi:hypothetical protein